MAAETVALSQHVVNAVVAHVLRWGRAPRVLLASSDDDHRLAIASELRMRGFEVVEAAHAQTLHNALLRSLADPGAHGFDLFVLDLVLDGCSPLHAMGYARRRGVDAAALLLAARDDESAREEATRLDLALCDRDAQMDAVDRALLRVMRRRWSERPIAA